MYVLVSPKTSFQYTSIFYPTDIYNLLEGPYTTQFFFLVTPRSIYFLAIFVCNMSSTRLTSLPPEPVGHLRGAWLQANLFGSAHSGAKVRGRDPAPRRTGQGQVRSPLLNGPPGLPNLLSAVRHDPPGGGGQPAHNRQG